MAETTDKRINNNDIDSLKSSFELDMIAMFNALQEEFFVLLEKAVKENWTSEVLITEVENLMEG